MTVIYIPDRLLVATIPLPNFNAPNHPVSIYVGMDEIMVLSSKGELLRYCTTLFFIAFLSHDLYFTLSLYVNRMSNFNLSALASALSNKDLAQAAEIQGNVKQDFVECLLKTTVKNINFTLTLNLFY